MLALWYTLEDICSFEEDALESDNDSAGDIESSGGLEGLRVAECDVSVVGLLMLFPSP